MTQHIATITCIKTNNLHPYDTIIALN